MKAGANDVNHSAVFFPGAGSFGLELRPLMDALGSASWIVRYPGRHGRDFGVPAESFDGVVRACTEQITHRTPAGLVLFGHSFGAFVAYATASRLEEAGTEVTALIIAGASAPGRLRMPEQVTRTPSDAARYLDSIDPGALADAPSDDWRQIVVETAVHDLRLLRQFDAASSTPVHCPIIAVFGDTDPLTSQVGVREWRNHTDGMFSMRRFAGGHSDFLRSSACSSWIREIRDNLNQRFSATSATSAARTFR